MKKIILAISVITAVHFFTACSDSSQIGEEGKKASWHNPLYLGHNNYWKKRIPLILSNNTGLKLEGDPATVTIGNKKGEIPLTGANAQAIRVVDEKGQQLLCRIDTPEGRLQEKGPIESGSILTVPMDCEAKGTMVCYVYFDNPSAWAVGEYFYTHRSTTNPSFEIEGPIEPVAWETSWKEKNRNASYSAKIVHSGNQSLFITAEEPSETEAFGATQSNLHLLPNIDYTIEVWIKAEGIKGEAGLLLQPANLGRTKGNLDLAPIKVKVEEGSYDWKKVSSAFTAPGESNILDISTRFGGTGKMWIDDIKLLCDFDYALDVEVLPVEHANLSELGKTAAWYAGTQQNANDWPLRAEITTQNFTGQMLENYPVYVDLQMLLNRIYAEYDENSYIQVTDGVNPIPSISIRDGLLFKPDLPASTSRSFYVYFSDRSRSGSIAEPESYRSLSEITSNMVANPYFDNATLTEWSPFGVNDSSRISREEVGGNSTLKLHLSQSGDEEDSEVPEIGVHQIRDVTASNTYFVSAMVKCSNILQRTHTLRTRFFNKAGKIVGKENSLRANPDMFQNNEWFSEKILIQAPEDAVSVKLELLNTAEGDVWYDDVFLLQVAVGRTGALALERKAAEKIKELTVWEVNPIVKVFPDDLPSQTLSKINLTAAKNEVEPVQLVFRSPEQYDDLSIDVSSLKDERGNTLDDLEIGIVGYVPINYPSNYYRDYETRFWKTKLAEGKIGSDGWVGMWPDPIIPEQTFDLPAHETTAAWIEVSVPEDAVAGFYKGAVTLSHQGKTLKKIPLEAQVYDFVLPEITSVDASYNIRFRETAMFGYQTTEEQKNRELLELMKEHRISANHIRPAPEFRMEDGKVVIDFTEYDKGAKLHFDEFQFQSAYSPRDFYIAGWAHDPRPFMGEQPYPGEPPYPGVDRSQMRPEYVRKYQSALKQYWNHLKEKGWADKVVVYISDEPHAEEHIEAQFKAACEMIREVDPEIPIYSSTWWYRPEFKGYVDVWGLSHRGGGWGHPVTVEDLEEITANGDDIYFTTDGMQCTDTPLLAFERMLPHFCFKYNASKYEFWAANWHMMNPYNYGWHQFHRLTQEAGVWQWIRYPNGDGNFIYPGQPIGYDHLVATIRLKQIREGVEDYEFLKILKDGIETKKKSGVDVSQAEATLERALELVTIPCADGRYTSQYLSDPDKVLTVRHEVALAIEALNK